MSAMEVSSGRIDCHRCREGFDTMKVGDGNGLLIRIESTDFTGRFRKMIQKFVK